MSSPNSAETEPLLPGQPSRTQISDTRLLTPLKHLLRIIPFLILYSTRAQLNVFTNVFLELDACGVPGSSSYQCMIGSWDLTKFRYVLGTVAILISTGLWTRLSDQIQSRGLILLIILSSLLLFDLVHTLVAKFSIPQTHPTIWFPIETTFNGLLGGDATKSALILAYAADVSLPSQRVVLFTFVYGLSIVSSILGELLLGVLTPHLRLENHSSIRQHIVSVILSVANILYIAIFFPKSAHRLEQTFRGILSLKNLLTTTLSPFTTFAPGVRFERKNMTVLGLALFAYSLTTGDGYRKSSYVSFRDEQLNWKMYWVMMLILTIINVVGLLVVLPVLITRCRITRTTSKTASDRLLAASIALGTTISDLLAFIPDSEEVVFMIFGIFVPAFVIVGIPPIIFSIGTLYFDQLGKQRDIGFMLGSMAALQYLGRSLAYYLFVAISGSNGITERPPKSVFLVTPGLLAIVTLSLYFLKNWDVQDNSVEEPTEESSALAPAEESSEEVSTTSV